MATSACGPSFEARREERRAPQDDGDAGLRMMTARITSQSEMQINHILKAELYKT
jgi:hypothetical protein